MSGLAPWAIAVPLLAAALLAAVGEELPRRTVEVAAILAAALSGGFCALLLVHSAGGPLVTWVGGWTPRGGVAVGIDLAVDRVGAGFALMACVLMTAALIVATHYFDDARARFQVLMLAFLAALVGFGLTGDLFNLFVFFELMGAASYALAGYRSEDEASLQGALAMGVENTVGALLVLVGIALLYGRTGALNLAQIGRAVAGRGDGLVQCAFALIACGFFVKAALVPFHFWLLDAHAIAPTPVCALFSGIMVEAGLYAVARTYATLFHGALAGSETPLRSLLVGAGALTAVIGAVLAFSQRHLKRLLAASTVAHMGLMVGGFGLLDARALAGTALYALGHGATKAALFLGVGVVLHRLRSVDELALRGRGRQLPVLGALFAVGGLALAGLPPTGLFLGFARIDAAAREHGFAWFGVLGLAVAATTGGAVLRAAGRIFLGWGARASAIAPVEGVVTEPPETPPERGRAAPLAMVGPAGVLLALAFALGLSHRFALGAHRATAQFSDAEGYAAAVLDGLRPRAQAIAPEPLQAAAYVKATLASLGAVALAAIALARERLPAGVRQLGELARKPVLVLRAWHAGDLRDYVVWLAVGAATFGALCAGLLG